MNWEIIAFLWPLYRPPTKSILHFSDLTVIISIGNLLDFLVGTV